MQPLLGISKPREITLLCRFSNCKLAVRSKVGLQRLAQLGESNVQGWGVTWRGSKVVAVIPDKRS